MAMLNMQYLTTNRGIIKIIQIIIGLLICSLLCSSGSAYGGNTCLVENRLEFVNGLNLIVVIMNIVLLVLNFLSISMFHVERVYSMILCVFFFIATIFALWFIITNTSDLTIFLTCALLTAQFALFVWDVKIIQGEAPN